MIYVIRRVLVGGLQIAVLSALMFGLFRLTPGDYYAAAAMEDPRLSPGSLNPVPRPWVVEYAGWLASCLRGDLGESIAYRLPVRELIRPRVGRTLQVALPGLVFAWWIGLGGALFLFRWRGGVIDPGISAAAMVPDVIFISFVIWVAVWLGLSITGAWLPVVGLTVSLIPVIFLHASSELRQASQLEFVRLAESRGVKSWRLWFRYILPAAGNPLVSLAGLSVAAAIGSSFVVEALTGWPGLGPLFLEAVRARDYPVVQTVLLGLSCILVISNLIADLALYRLDPRIRAGA